MKVIYAPGAVPGAFKNSDGQNLLMLYVILLDSMNLMEMGKNLIAFHINIDRILTLMSGFQCLRFHQFSCPSIFYISPLSYLPEKGPSSGYWLRHYERDKLTLLEIKRTRWQLPLPKFPILSSWFADLGIMSNLQQSVNSWGQICDIVVRTC